MADGTTMLGGVGLDTTVMAAPSLRKRGYTCLSADDIDGLQHAYPHCGRPHHGTPICIEVKRFTWAFRALVVVGGPILVGAVVLFLAVYCARHPTTAKSGPKIALFWERHTAR